MSFPTCVSINRCSAARARRPLAARGPHRALKQSPRHRAARSVVGHFSPSADDATVVKDGDVVKM